jgi:hypothetical protein
MRANGVRTLAAWCGGRGAVLAGVCFTLALPAAAQNRANVYLFSLIGGRPPRLCDFQLQ